MLEHGLQFQKRIQRKKIVRTSKIRMQGNFSMNYHQKTTKIELFQVSTKTLVDVHYYEEEPLRILKHYNLKLNKDSLPTFPSRIRKILCLKNFGLWLKWRSLGNGKVDSWPISEKEGAIRGDSVGFLHKMLLLCTFCFIKNIKPTIASIYNRAGNHSKILCTDVKNPFYADWKVWCGQKIEAQAKLRDEVFLSDTETV